MRIWSLHPKYLDAKGIVALWREGLLALAVLQGTTKGYIKHPQLERFRRGKEPIESMKCYLWHIFLEATARGYRFNPSKIQNRKNVPPISVTAGQLIFELEHLRKKLRTRNPEKYDEIDPLKEPEPHPVFIRIPGQIEAWEKTRP
jgi:hypothetical protein